MWMRLHAPPILGSSSGPPRASHSPGSTSLSGSARPLTLRITGRRPRARTSAPCRRRWPSSVTTLWTGRYRRANGRLTGRSCTTTWTSPSRPCRVHRWRVLPLLGPLPPLLDPSGTDGVVGGVAYGSWRTDTSARAGSCRHPSCPPGRHTSRLARSLLCQRPSPPPVGGVYAATLVPPCLLSSPPSVFLQDRGTG